MAFGDRRGNSSNETDNNDIRKSLNTRGRGFYNENGFEATAISFQFWKELLKLQIAPALPEEKRTTTNRYDYSTGISVYLTADKARDFYNCLEIFYSEYIKGGNPPKMGIATKSGLVEIATGESLKIKGKPRSIFLVLYDNIDEETKTDVYITFEFPESKIIKEYNNGTGTFETEAAQGSFEVFMNDILNFCNVTSGALAHAIRWGAREDTYQDNLKMAALLKANDIKLDDAGRVAFERKENPFNKNTGKSSSAPAQKSRPAINSSIEDIERELDNMDSESEDLPF